MNLLRRLVPPVRVGNVALDTGFLILIVLLSFLLNIMMTTYPRSCLTLHGPSIGRYEN